MIWIRNRRKRNKTEQRVSGSNNKTKTTGKHKRTEVVVRCNTVHGEILTKVVGTDRPIEENLKTNEPWKWGPEQEADLNWMKQMLMEGPCLAHYAKDEDNMVTTDVSKTGLGITL